MSGSDKVWVALDSCNLYSDDLRTLKNENVDYPVSNPRHTHFMCLLNEIGMVL